MRELILLTESVSLVSSSDRASWRKRVKGALSSWAVIAKPSMLDREGREFG